MNLSANGFLAASLTFQSESEITTGTPVVLSDNFTVAAADEGDAFCGVLLSCRDNLCCVQLKGAVTLPYSGTAPEVGTALLAADGEGGVAAADAEDGGTTVLILAVDTTASTVTCIL